MFAIDSATASPTLPTIPAAGTPGYFQQGVPGTSTIVTDWWLNMIQAELLRVAAVGNVTPSKTDWTQVSRAIARLSSAAVTALTASATLTADNLGLVTIDATAGALVITLPPAACLLAGVPARLRLVRNANAPANGVTVQLAGTDAFGGGTATTLPLWAGDVVDLVSDGAGTWWASRPSPTNWITCNPGWGTAVQPVGFTGVEVEAVGPGGSGAGGDATSAGGGGGAGGTARGSAHGVTHGTVYTWVVGSGGAAPAASTTGNPGTVATTWGGGSALALTAGPGGGGAHGSSPSGGAGGIATGGNDNIPGGDGGDGSPGSSTIGGLGGASSLGGGGRGGTDSGKAGQAQGSGGGGGYLYPAGGGAGAPGTLRYRFIP